MDGYDIIGDIHGHAGHLRRLLGKLGYGEVGGVYEHEGRQAVFLGDLIDRGPNQVEVLEIVKAMVDRSKAQIVMGNHEFNAIAYATPHEQYGWCRPHSDKNFRQHKSFLQQVGWHNSREYGRWTEWFRDMPMWLELPDGPRVIHACWDDRVITAIETESPDQRVTPKIIEASATMIDKVDVDPLGEAVELILKGPEIDLPAGLVFLDKDKHERSSARFRWWLPQAETLDEVSEIPDGSTAPDGSPFGPLPHRTVNRVAYPAAPELVPVLVGHYWRTGKPTIETDHFACLDWSVAKGGSLVAYRWNTGDQTLIDDSDHLVVVD